MHGYLRRTANVRSYDAWEGPLGDYLTMGDAVDDALYWHFVEVLPPAYWDPKRLLQVGEPHDHNGPDDSPRFTTFQRDAGVWIYTGHRPLGEFVTFYVTFYDMELMP